MPIDVDDISRNVFLQVDDQMNDVSSDDVRTCTNRRVTIDTKSMYTVLGSVQCTTATSWLLELLQSSAARAPSI